MKTKRLNITKYGLAISFLLMTGCSVAPWERGILARPQMALDPHPEQSLFRSHVYGSREAATGSTAGSGGGCGCY